MDYRTRQRREALRVHARQGDFGEARGIAAARGSQWRWLSFCPDLLKLVLICFVLSYSIMFCSCGRCLAPSVPSCLSVGGVVHDESAAACGLEWEDCNLKPSNMWGLGRLVGVFRVSLVPQQGRIRTVQIPYISSRYDGRLKYCVRSPRLEVLGDRRRRLAWDFCLLSQAAFELGAQWKGGGRKLGISLGACGGGIRR